MRILSLKFKKSMKWEYRIMQVTFLIPSNFFPQMKKVLKGKHFAYVEEVKQKMAEVLKGIKIDEFKNCFEQWKNVLIGVLHQMESVLKDTEV